MLAWGEMRGRGIGPASLALGRSIGPEHWAGALGRSIGPDREVERAASGEGAYVAGAKSLEAVP